MANITRTFLRSDATMTRYMETMKHRDVNNIQYNPFTDQDRKIVNEFNYWIIVENGFPYDAIATTSHILSIKREIPFDWDLLTAEERVELDHLKKTYFKENYDVVYENLPKGQTVPGHFHLHLLVLRREEI